MILTSSLRRSVVKAELHISKQTALTEKQQSILDYLIQLKDNLPSIAAIARNRNISREGMLSVLRALQDKGYLVFGGRKIQLTEKSLLGSS